jgi:hypothetical protein
MHTTFCWGNILKAAAWSSRRRMDIIKMDGRECGCDTARWMELAHNHASKGDLVLEVWTFRLKTETLYMEYYLILEYL